MDPTPIWRPTARLLVLDPPDRVLLLSADDPRGRVWFTPAAAPSEAATPGPRRPRQRDDLEILRIGSQQFRERQYYARPPLLDTLLLRDDAERPRRKYLDWHREKVFVA